MSSLDPFHSHCGITWDSLHSHDNFGCVFIKYKVLFEKR